MSELNLEQYLAKPMHVQISRPFAITPRLDGYVIATSSDWVLLHCFHDFTPDGFSIVARKQISEIAGDSTEGFFHRVLEAEGLLDGLDTWKNLELGTLTESCTELQEASMLIAVECETESGEDDQYDVGVIRSADEGELVLVPFDTEGKWQSEIKIDLRKVTRLQFGTPYLTIYSRHLEGELPESGP